MTADPELVDEAARLPRRERWAGRLRTPRAMAGVVVLALAIGWLVQVVDRAALGEVGRAVWAAPLALAVALVGYAAAFAVRAWTWPRVLPALTLGQSWAAIHVSLLGNHVLPLRLGEILRVTSVLRRTALKPRAVISSVVLLRLGDLLALLVVAAVSTPAALVAIVGVGGATGVAVLLFLALGTAWWWVARMSRQVDAAREIRRPDLLVGVATVGAWLLEASVLFAVAQSAGLPVTVWQAAGVTAITVFAQVVAVTPGGFGTYEAAGTAALVALGFPAGEAFAVVLLTHGVKTVYSLVVGGAAFFVPAPGYFGRFRLPRSLPPRPVAPGLRPTATGSVPLPSGTAVDPREAVGADVLVARPIVVFLPAHNEEEVIASVIVRIPPVVHGHLVEVLVIDDGSADATATTAAEAGAEVISLGHNRGLGAAVRRGLAESAAREPAAGVYLDADGEYPPEDIGAVVAPVLSGQADYVIGSRFTGQIETMLPHRRIGNLALTRWLRWTARRPDLTDGQSGFRAFSPAALSQAEVVHDYNYAQVLTLDLLGKGFTYAEVPIGYTFRTTGTSFIRLGRYLRKVVPAVHRELNDGGQPR
ncbi:MAG: lysylphosphatidylglycerol synthase domain-containing protein [Ornithinimicrobium sp.]